MGAPTSAHDPDARFPDVDHRDVWLKLHQLWVLSRRNAETLESWKHVAYNIEVHLTLALRRMGRDGEGA